MLTAWIWLGDGSKPTFKIALGRCYWFGTYSKLNTFLSMILLHSARNASWVERAKPVQYFQLGRVFKKMGEAIYVTLYFYAYDLININDDNFFQLCKNDPVTFCYTCSGFYPEKRKIINPTSHNSGIPTIPFLSLVLCIIS